MLQFSVHTDTHIEVFILDPAKLMLVTQMNRWVWRLEHAIVGLELVRAPDLLRENEDDDLDIERGRD